MNYIYHDLAQDFYLTTLVFTISQLLLLHMELLTSALQYW